MQQLDHPGGLTPIFCAVPTDAELKNKPCDASSSLTSLVTSIRGNQRSRPKIFRLVTRQVKLAIESSRVIVYTFDEHWNGTIVG